MCLALIYFGTYKLVIESSSLVGRIGLQERCKTIDLYRRSASLAEFDKKWKKSDNENINRIRARDDMYGMYVVIISYDLQVIRKWDST